MLVKKAVIPAAGLGTRFLPATKSQPKEMMPILDKPTIHYIVEEVVKSGIEDILIITGRGKQAIVRYFDKAYGLEKELKALGKTSSLAKIRNFTGNIDIHYVRQKERKGLGDAILYAEKHVGNEPFVVLLGDTIIDSKMPCTKRLINQYEKYHKPIVLLEEVPWKNVSRYGVAEISEEVTTEECFPVEDLVEKPSQDNAPSNLAIAGRYVLTSDIFDLLRETEPGVGGELQLTDALRKMERIGGYELQGKRYDIGNIPSWLKTNIELALEHKDFKIEKFIRGLLDE